MTVQQYCLRWNNHQPNFISVFSSLLNSQSLVDVTLAAEGTHLQAHKVVLSACSSYFQSLFTVNPCKHPIVILKDVKFADLKVMVDFMYHGEVNVSQEQLPCILKTAEMLKIKGLTEIPVDQSAATRCQSKLPVKPEIPSQDEGIWSLEENNRPPSPASPNSKRKRLKKNVICSTSGTSTDPTTEPGSGDIILSTMDNVFGTVTKVETDRYSTDSTTSAPTTPQQQHHQQQQPQKCNGVPVPSIQAGPSHEMQEQVEQTHHISLQVTSHDVSTSHNVECPTMEIPRTTIAQQTPTVLTSPSSQSPTQEIPHMGPKRGRFLMRQPRIKRESDPSQEPSEGGEPPMASTSHYLTVPPIRIERQCSDPTPSVSPSPENLLHVQEHVLVKQHSHPLLPTKSPECSNTRSSHCPMVRDGPALSCNFCWNTVDNHGRILRRKTKYHCPECQTNLCIVPCFQEYHKCPRPSSSEPPSSTVVTSPTSQTTSVLQGSPTKTFPKNS